MVASEQEEAGGRYNVPKADPVVRPRFPLTYFIT